MTATVLTSIAVDDYQHCVAEMTRIWPGVDMQILRREGNCYIVEFSGPSVDTLMTKARLAEVFSKN